jgi:ribose transport system substrate-binding protein
VSLVPAPVTDRSGVPTRRSGAPGPFGARSVSGRSGLGLLAVAAVVVLAAGVLAVGADDRHYTIAFANLIDEPGVTIEDTGFTGADVRDGFLLAARSLPVEVLTYDNGRDCRRALANVEDAIGRKVDLYIQYCHDASVNAAIADKLKAARIPVLAISGPVAGAPLYMADNREAGRIAGEALGRFASRWDARSVEAVVVGRFTPASVQIAERAEGVIQGLQRRAPSVRATRLDTQGNPALVAQVLGKFLAAHPSSKVLVAGMDDPTALAAKAAIETAGRTADAAIVGQGVDRTIHGGMSEKKELDPSNRGSIVLGSVAFYLDRYGYEVLPIALRMLRGEPVPARTVTRHRLITSATIFTEYPPRDMQ